MVIELDIQYKNKKVEIENIINKVLEKEIKITFIIMISLI